MMMRNYNSKRVSKIIGKRFQRPYKKSYKYFMKITRRQLHQISRSKRLLLIFKRMSRLCQIVLFQSRACNNWQDKTRLRINYKKQELKHQTTKTKANLFKKLTKK